MMRERRVHDRETGRDDQQRAKARVPLARLLERLTAGGDRAKRQQAWRMQFGRAWEDFSRRILQVNRTRKERPLRRRMAGAQRRSQRLRFRQVVELLRMRFCCRAPSVKRSHRMVRVVARSAARVAVEGLAILSPEIREGRVEGRVDAEAVDSVAEEAGLAEGPAVAERVEGEEEGLRVRR